MACVSYEHLNTKDTLDQAVTNKQWVPYSSLNQFNVVTFQPRYSATHTTHIKAFLVSTSERLLLFKSHFVEL